MKDESSKVTVLSVGPVEEDHAALSGMIAGSGWPLCAGLSWTLKTSPSLPMALAALRTEEIVIVVCDRDLGTETWKDLWQEAAALPNPPLLIVTSRLADEFLWAEALNLGAYDVLAKPFDPTEVARTLSQAWLHRTYRQYIRKRPLSAVGSTQPSLDSEHSLAV